MKHSKEIYSLLSLIFIDERDEHWRKGKITLGNVCESLRIEYEELAG